jgi:hypothetical protein
MRCQATQGDGPPIRRCLNLSGRNTGRLFRRHTGPTDIPVGADLSYLLNTCPRFDIGATT